MSEQGHVTMAASKCQNNTFSCIIFYLYSKVNCKEVGFIPSHSIKCWSMCIETTKCKCHKRENRRKICFLWNFLWPKWIEISNIIVQIASLPDIVSREMARGMRRCLTPILVLKLWVFFWECFQWEEDPDFFFLESHPLSYPNIPISANVWQFIETQSYEQYCAYISRLYSGVHWTLYKSTLLLP